MENFSLQHAVLYSKGWYKKYDPKGKRKTLWDDLSIILEMDGYLGTFAGDSPEQIKNRVAYLLVSQLQRIPLTGNARTLSDFYESIKEYNCWKFGYYTKNNSHWLRDSDDKPEYDYNEAVARYCLSEFSRLDFTQWKTCKPDYSVMRKSNDIKDKAILKMFK